jgi:hypothetical protein
MSPILPKAKDDENKYIRKESFYLVLDSKNASAKSNGSLHSDVTFNIASPLIAPNDTLYITWCVSSFTCPVSFYLVNSTNNTIVLQVSTGGIFTYTLPIGNYNVNNFMTALLSIIPSGFAMTFNSINNIYTLTNTLYNFQLISTTMHRVIGLAKNTSYTSTSNSLTMPYPVNFSGLSNFNIHCQSIRTKNLDSNEGLSMSDIICSVNVNASSNGVIYFEKKNDFEFDVKERIINYLDFDFLDDDGNYLDFNNAHWHMVIQVNYIKEYIKDTSQTFMDIISDF